MPTDRRARPGRCPICGYELTDDAHIAGYRCVDPAHWRAAGLPALVVLTWARAKLTAPPSPGNRPDDDAPF